MSMMPQGSAEDDEVMATINTTPLVDVMLVLLIIFLLTIPVVTHTVPVQLPREKSSPDQTLNQTIHLSVDRSGKIWWDQSPITLSELQQRLNQRAAEKPQPEVQIRGDRNSSYEPVGRIVLACQRAGLGKVGFVTQPGGNP
jgi:biopolymer transport protein ExbD